MKPLPKDPFKRFESKLGVHTIPPQLEGHVKKRRFEYLLA